MPWIKEVPSVLEAWFSGTESGNALASVLVGDVNPSGKLPMTFAVRLEDYPAHTVGEYPGDSINVKYNEGIFVGYRWTDKHKIRSLFPFGHGLSYTTFQYAKALLSSSEMNEKEILTVTIPIKNTGKVKGKEIVQLYIGDEKSSLERPVKELKGFQKIELNPGEEKVVEFNITSNDLKFYDEAIQDWKAEQGKFNIFIGSSSTDIRAKTKFNLK